MAIQLQVETSLGYWQTLNSMSDNEPINIVSYRLRDLNRSQKKRARAIDAQGRLLDIVG